MISGGESFVSAPPAFSNDGRKLLVCTGCTVSVFSTSTGMKVTELEGHAGRVTSVVVVPVAAPASKVVNYCWTSSLDNTICYWDFAAAELLKKVNVELPVYHMVIPRISSPVGSNEQASNLYAVISLENVDISAEQNKLHGQIRIYDLTNSRRVGGVLAETQKPSCISVSKTGEFFGTLYKRRLNIWRIPARSSKYEDVQKIKLHHTKNFTTLAFHPNNRIVAAGDVTGRILIWMGFGKNKFSGTKPTTRGGKNIAYEDRPGVRGNDDADSCSTWHWHSREVTFLFFSSDGSYLYSGGKEGVIVVWQLDTGKKKFKPRLGSPILYFTDSPDPSISCVSCADNQIHLLKMPTMGILKSIAGIKVPFSVPNRHEGLFTEFAYDRASWLVALQTQDYCVQFFNLYDNVEVSQVQVCERNYHPVDDVTVYVALIAVSADGSLMGTVDVRLPEEGLGGLVSLKFWIRGSCAGEYSLSTIIYEPHSDAGIAALAFRPNHVMAVTSSFGGDFKIWVQTSSREANDQFYRTGWRCQSVGSYKKKPMTAAAFSADGSVLAVAADTVITLWDPDTNTLVSVIGDSLSTITLLSFIGKSSYLVSLAQGSQPHVAVWDTSRLLLSWSYKLIAEAVSSTEDGSHFAVLVLQKSVHEATTIHNGVILLFKAEDPIPVSYWTVNKAKGGGLVFLPSNPTFESKSTEEGASLLAFINGDHEYVVFDPHNTRENLKARNLQKRQVPSEEEFQVGYASIYGDLPDLSLKKEQVPELPFVPAERPWETLFTGPSHTSPPLSKLCSTFLSSLMERRQNADE